MKTTGSGRGAKRTRKWVFVSQEARRLSDLGLRPQTIARRLGVDKSTVTRWMASGKLQSSRKRRAKQSGASKVTPPPQPPKSAAEWAKDIRESYDLDATDDQLVTVAQAALVTSLDPNATPSLRLQAAGRFQSLVKQLALVARSSEASNIPPEQDTKPKAPLRVIQRPTADPRKALMATSS